MRVDHSQAPGAFANDIVKELMRHACIKTTLKHYADVPHLLLAAAKGKALGRIVLETVACIVTPETILAWHRRLGAL